MHVPGYRNSRYQARQIIEEPGPTEELISRTFSMPMVSELEKCELENEDCLTGSNIPLNGS